MIIFKGITILIALIFLNSDILIGGFGWLKTTIEINRKIPPQLKLSGAINIQANSVDFEYDWLNSSLKKRISQAIIENNPKLKISKDASNLSLIIKIHKYNIDQKWNSIEVKKTIETECEEEAKEKKCRKEIKEVQMFLFIEGELEIECEILDNKHSQSLFSNFFISNYKDKFVWGSEIPSLREIEKILEEGILKGVLPLFIYTTEIIRIPLAKGKNGELKRGNDYAENWVWGEAIKHWKSANIDLTDPEAKSNLLYNIGISKECQAYNMINEKSMLSQLYESLKYIEEAISIYPKEKIYFQAQERISSYIRLW